MSGIKILKRLGTSESVSYTCPSGKTFTGTLIVYGPAWIASSVSVGEPFLQTGSTDYYNFPIILLQGQSITISYYNTNASIILVGIEE